MPISHHPEHKRRDFGRTQHASLIFLPDLSHPRQAQRCNVREPKGSSQARQIAPLSTAENTYSMHSSGHALILKLLQYSTMLRHTSSIQGVRGEGSDERTNERHGREPSPSPAPGWSWRAQCPPSPLSYCTTYSPEMETNETRTIRTGYEPGQEEEGTLFSGLWGGSERGTGPPVPAPAAAVADRHPYMQSQYLPLKG